MVKKLFVLTLLVTLSACSTDRLDMKLDNAVNKEKVSRIRKNTTTQSQVVEIFGEPLDRLVTPDGETFFYKDFNLRLFHVEFDRNGVVKDFLYNY